MLQHRLHGLDHLRALAILIVMCWHYMWLGGTPQALDSFSRFGWTGVDLFFVLSGFLIGNQLMQQLTIREKVSYKQFYIRRSFRILPMYFAVLLIYFTVPGAREQPSIAPLWKFLTFTMNIGLDLGKHRAFSHAWSLCVEEYFYLLLPAILMMLYYFKAGARSMYVVLGLFVAGMIARAIIWQTLLAPLKAGGDVVMFTVNYHKWIYYPTYSRLDGLLVGVSIAAIFNYRQGLRDKLMRYGNLWFALGLITLFAAWFLCIDIRSFYASVFGFPLVSFGYGFLVLAALSPSCFLYRFGSKLSVFIATVSYSTYLTHKPLMHFIREQLDMPADSLLLFAVCMVASLLLGGVFYIAIERPFLQLRDRVLKKNFQAAVS